ncbi:MAG: hypothetical protein ACRDRK_16450 [Pseudonocardia sp.]
MTASGGGDGEAQGGAQMRAAGVLRGEVAPARRLDRVLRRRRRLRVVTCSGAGARARSVVGHDVDDLD